MILEQAKVLDDLAKEKMKRARLGDKLARFGQLRDDLDDLYRAVSSTCSAASLFREAGIGALSPRLEAAMPKQTLGQAILQFEERPEWILDQRNFHFAVFRNIVRQLCEAADAELMTMWQQHADRKIPPISREELEVLAEDPRLRSKVNAVREAAAVATQLAGRTPRDKDQLHSFEERVAELVKGWTSLIQAAGGHAPPDVITFLQRASTVDGAPLSLLTETVSDWLQKSGRVGRYVVRSVGFTQQRM